jgi:hypothetical protein
MKEMNDIIKNIKPIILVVLSLLLAGCYRGRPSEKQPVHLNRDMDSQPKYKAQSEGSFFTNSSAMRLPAEGTVAQGQLREDDAFFRGQDDDGEFLRKTPVPLTESGLSRGRERFDIYCSVCHGRIGDGRGVMVKKGYIPPPSFHIDRIRQMDDGEIFDVISNGIRNMPSYRNQIPVRDRWQIIHYLRALQRSQNAAINDIPETMRKDLK